MGYFTTTYEGGPLKRLPVKTKHGNIIRQLKNNKKRLRSNAYPATHVKLSAIQYPYLVHACFFINEKNLRIKKVWDASIGFRKLKKGFSIPRDIFNQIR